jgi:uncharacterized protein (TIGR02996 family)
MNVSLGALIEAHAEGLIPADCQTLASVCQASPEDSAPKLILADWLMENGEPGLEYALRWLARHGFGPGLNRHARWSLHPHGAWEVPNCAMVPDWIGGAEGTWWQMITHVSKKLEEIKESLRI